MTVKIQNGSTTITLSFDHSTADEFITAINNCIKNPLKYPTIDYQDKTDKIIFTAEFLKNSLIIIPKENHD